MQAAKADILKQWIQEKGVSDQQISEVEREAKEKLGRLQALNLRNLTFIHDEEGRKNLGYIQSALEYSMYHKKMDLHLPDLSYFSITVPERPKGTLQPDLQGACHKAAGHIQKIEAYYTMQVLIQLCDAVYKKAVEQIEISKKAAEKK